ncbi:hypothetical protein [uncultured Clostridium sp.]|uniref:hypothetical protein n=1 Tax=uncultured Clostridium sp. TaxID=59620 RepID=UPI0025DB4733|nr:hypothetical protein [uncultured Clostridium sp.]
MGTVIGRFIWLLWAILTVVVSVAVSMIGGLICVAAAIFVSPAALIASLIQFGDKKRSI